MSGYRAIGLMNRRCEELGLPIGHCFRRWYFTSQFTPQDGELGWYGRSLENDAEVFLGGNMDVAMMKLEHLSEDNGKRKTG